MNNTGSRTCNIGMNNIVIPADCVQGLIASTDSHYGKIKFAQWQNPVQEFPTLHMPNGYTINFSTHT